MKAFTTVMKIAILLVTIALVAMLAISTIPLVTGGVNVETVEDMNITYNATAVEVNGKYTVVSSIDQDISDLVIEAYLLSRDGNARKDLVSVGPVTISKDNPRADIIIDESIPIAEVALFFVADNMDKETPGLNLPVTIHIKGSYSSNLAGIDMKLVYNVPLSDTGMFSIGNTQTTVSGDISHAEIELSGIDGLAGELIPENGAEFSMQLPDGKTLDLEISKDAGGNITLAIGTTDETNVSIQDIIDTALDLLKSESDEDLTFSFVGDGGTPQEYTFKPSDIENLDPEKAEQAKEYIAQLEGISGSLESLLDKYKSMTGGA